jgi:hypothetical protein
MLLSKGFWESQNPSTSLLKTGNYGNETHVFYMQPKNLSIKSKERAVTVTVHGE